MIIPNDRYAMTEVESSMYAIQMVLIIKKLHKADFGGYKCISKNSIGGIEATIRLYGKYKRELYVLFVLLLLLLPCYGYTYIIVNILSCHCTTTIFKL